MRLFISLIVTLMLSGCAATEQQALLKAITSNNAKNDIKQLVKSKTSEYAQQPQNLINDAKALQQLVQAFIKSIDNIWGEKDNQTASKKRYVKYTNDLQNRAIVDFSRGIMRIETLAKQQPETVLEKAIVTSLLTPENPEEIELFSDKAIALNGAPFLYGQVKDNDNKFIRYQWRAQRFAHHLITNKLKKRRVENQDVYYVDIALISNHQDHRKDKYKTYVNQAAKRYQLPPELIYAIIETESSFNPFAVSHANAYGLMQVVPATAGRDVYDKVKHISGQPTQKQLFNAATNIDIGAAYLHLLGKRYLIDINNATARHYSVISAYNGGAGNVFKTFAKTRDQAKANINRLSSSKVYDKLTNQHPRQESRRYLQKVRKAQGKYSGG
jgi:membrane-bound lytic murein transglycosylase C